MPEVLEYQAGGRIIEFLEASYPGLREFVERIGAVAGLEASLRVARAAYVPQEVVACFQEAVDVAWAELKAFSRTIQCSDLEMVLRSYAQIADVAEMLEF